MAVRIFYHPSMAAWFLYDAIDSCVVSVRCNRWLSGVSIIHWSSLHEGRSRIHQPYECVAQGSPLHPRRSRCEARRVGLRLAQFFTGTCMAISSAAAPVNFL